MKTSTEDILRKVIFKNLDKNKYNVFLFWSRAKGDYHKKSDWDIWFEWKEKLNFRKFLNLKRELNELPYLIDLVDFKLVDNDFKKIALKFVKKWN